MIYDFLQADRSYFLNLAVQDVLKWCVGPDQKVGKKPSDQFWMQLFGGANDEAIEEHHAHHFLVTFQLANRVKWDKPLVASLLIALRMQQNFAPRESVPALATALRAANQRHTNQTSAASKLSTFAKPKAQIFIWDELASRSARLRNWARNGREGRFGSKTVYLTADGAHDYAAFHQSCSQVFAEELVKEDFRAAANQLRNVLRGRPGPIADQDKVPDEFIDRRLLDKLMFHEGWSLKYKRLPTLG